MLVPRSLIVLTGLALLGAGLVVPARGPSSTTILIAGDFSGYLAPCGCFKPMMGGIRRLGTAVKAAGSDSIFLANGSLIKFPGRQSELKAETLAEALKQMGVAAVNLTADDAALGASQLASVSRLSGQATLTGSAEGIGLPATLAKGPFVIGGASQRASLMAERLGAKPVAMTKVASELVQLGKDVGRIPILMLDGNLVDAKSVAEQVPELKLIVYRASVKPTPDIEKVGNVVLVSPGDRGKFLVRLTWDGHSFSDKKVIELDPSIADNPDAVKSFKTYLQRVRDENLLDKVPRGESDAFAGSAACQPCHTKEHEIWAASAHAHALATLEAVGQDRDPDCVGCHVVGLTAKGGFTSRQMTPKLTDVGCESCHGPAAKHVAAPSQAPMKKAGGFSCLQCHVPDHSPGYSFQAWWKKIAH